MCTSNNHTQTAMTGRRIYLLASRWFRPLKKNFGNSWWLDSILAMELHQTPHRCSPLFPILHKNAQPSTGLGLVNLDVF